MAQDSLNDRRGQLNFITMKNLFKLFTATVLVIILGTSLSFAGITVKEESKKSDFQVAFLPQNLDQLVVSFEAENDDVKIDLMNEEGKVLHTEAMSGSGIFSKRYDLSELNKGIYSFRIQNGTETHNRTLVLK